MRIFTLYRAKTRISFTVFEPEASDVGWQNRRSSTHHYFHRVNVNFDKMCIMHMEQITIPLSWNAPKMARSLIEFLDYKQGDEGRYGARLREEEIALVPAAMRRELVELTLDEFPTGWRTSELQIDAEAWSHAE